MQRALSDSSSSSPSDRIAALKLLGVALSGATCVEAWGPRPDEFVQKVMKQLASMETIDESPGVRQLAHKLMSTAFATPLQ